MLFFLSTYTLNSSLGLKFSQGRHPNLDQASPRDEIRRNCTYLLYHQLYIQARIFGPTNLACFYPALTQHCAENYERARTFHPRSRVIRFTCGPSPAQPSESVPQWKQFRKPVNKIVTNRHKMPYSQFVLYSHVKNCEIKVSSGYTSNSLISRIRLIPNQKSIIEVNSGRLINVLKKRGNLISTLNNDNDF